MSATVKDVMTTRVVAVRKNAPFKNIAALLTRYRVSAFPVLDDDGTVIGVVSEADLLCKEALISAMGGPAARHGRQLIAAPGSFVVGSQNTLLDGETARARRWGMMLGAVSKTYLPAPA
jgi:hypothetical protein